MLKQSFVFTVSLIAVLAVGVDAATASIPSTGYVNTALEGKQQKLTAGQGGNLKGEGTVDVSIDDTGIITITGAEYELASESVTTDKIANGAVTAAKIASGVIPTVNNATLTIKNGATNTDLATFTANSATAATATIPAATPDVAGLAKYGLIPQGSATSTNYATIWVE